MIHPFIINSRGHFVKRIDKFQSIIKKFIASRSGKISLGNSTINYPGGGPLRRNIDYHSVARKTFLVDSLPPGALPVYDTGIDVSACLKNKFKHDVIRVNSRGFLRKMIRFHGNIISIQNRNSLAPEFTI